MTGDRLVDLRDVEISVDECLDAVRSPGAGGVAVFLGVVRDVDHGRPVDTLEYSAHPGARSVLDQLVDGVLAGPGVIAVAALHRVGELRVGDIAVVVAVSAAHRAEAFEGARNLIDGLKETVPIWKRQGFADGDVEWVGSC